MIHQSVQSSRSTSFSQSTLSETSTEFQCHELGSCSRIPVISFLAFLDYLAPPQPDFDLNATMQSLRFGSEPSLTSSNRWSKISKTRKDFRGSEDNVFSLIPEIFTRVVVAIAANSRGKLSEEDRTIDFLQNPSLAQTWDKRDNESRLDGYLVLKRRSKVMSEDGTEDILWDDIVLSCEYKLRLEDSDDDLDNVRIHQGI